MAKMTIVYRSPKDLIPYDHNPKMHGEEQVEALARNMMEYDFDVPIVVDENNVIIKGHGRRLAAMEAGIDKVPVIIRKDLTEDQAKLVRIADNKLGESPWDTDALIDEITFLNENTDLELDLTGFDEDFLNSILEEEVELVGIVQPVTESRAVSEVEGYKPKTDPTIESPSYEEEDFTKKQEELDAQFEKETDNILVTCPHCAEEFYIESK